MNTHLSLARNFATLLDSRFQFLGIRFGIDPLLDLIPGLGDVIGLVLSLYMLWIGKQMGLPSHKMAKMLDNILLDFLIGAVPVLGAFADVYYKANIRNLRILESHTVAR